MAYDLSKKTQSAKYNLKKKNIERVKSSQVLTLDISGSMSGLYDNGTVQEIVERILALSLNIDDDGSIDIWTFDDGTDKIESATIENIENFVKNQILKNNSISKWGSTVYSKPIKQILQFFFDEKKSLFNFFSSKKKEANKYPVTVQFVTDGDNDWCDKSSTEELIKDSQEHNVYWNFIGIGSGNTFEYLKKLASQYPNAGFTTIHNVSEISDDEMYDKLLNAEYVQWIKKFQ